MTLPAAVDMGRHRVVNIPGDHFAVGESGLLTTRLTATENT